jgi:hypothetical protein
MDVLSAIIIAEKTITLGKPFVDKLIEARDQGKKTISREDLEELLTLPSFDSFIEEETGDNTTDEQ